MFRIKFQIRVSPNDPCNTYDETFSHLEFENQIVEEKWSFSHLLSYLKNLVSCSISKVLSVTDTQHFAIDFEGFLARRIDDRPIPMTEWDHMLCDCKRGLIRQAEVRSYYNQRLTWLVTLLIRRNLRIIWSRRRSQRIWSSLHITWSRINLRIWRSLRIIWSRISLRIWRSQQIIWTGISLRIWRSSWIIWTRISLRIIWSRRCLIALVHRYLILWWWVTLGRTWSSIARPIPNISIIFPLRVALIWRITHTCCSLSCKKPLRPPKKKKPWWSRYLITWVACTLFAILQIQPKQLFTHENKA